MKTEGAKAFAEVLLEAADYLEGIRTQKAAKIGITVIGSEHGPAEVKKGIELASRLYSDIECIPIGEEFIEREDHQECEKMAHDEMERLLKNKSIDAAVTMHYNFPIGVATVGRVLVPASGKEIFLATTTGSTSSRRVEALVQNAIAGIAAAKACGINTPSIGFLNIDGARQAEKMIQEMQDSGYEVSFASSHRSDGGTIMRGNDLLTAACDVMVMDSLTGNILMKILSSYQTGGNFEAVGYGYGPGIGIEADKIVCILSRASGAPVVAGAIRYAADSCKGELLKRFSLEWKSACRAGVERLLEEFRNQSKSGHDDEPVRMPPEKVATEEIAGIDILDLEEAVRFLWSAGVYGKTGMGCTGPVIMVAEEDKEAAEKILHNERFI